MTGSPSEPGNDASKGEEDGEEVGFSSLADSKPRFSASAHSDR